MLRASAGSSTSQAGSKFGVPPRGGSHASGTHEGERQRSGGERRDPDEGSAGDADGDDGGPDLEDDDRSSYRLPERVEAAMEREQLTGVVHLGGQQHRGAAQRAEEQTHEE